MPRFLRPAGRSFRWRGFVLATAVVLVACTPDSDPAGGVSAPTTTEAPYPGSPSSSVEALDGAAGIFSAFIIRPATAGLDPGAITGDATGLMSFVDPDRLAEQVDALVATRTDNPQVSLDEAAAVVEDRFERVGTEVELIDVSFSPEGSSDELTAPIIAGRVDGVECPERVVVVAAPYGAAPDSPGADANASGVAAMLELVEIFEGRALPMTLVFAAVPFGPAGAEELLAALNEPRGEGSEEPEGGVVGLIAVDRVGVTSEDFDDLVGVEHAYLLALVDEQSEYLGRVFAVSSELFLPEFWAWSAQPPYDRFPDFDDSIQAPFWDAGVAGMWVTDTGALRDDRVGTSADTAEIIDLDFLANSTRALVAGLVGLGTIEFDRDGRFDVCTRPL